MEDLLLNCALNSKAHLIESSPDLVTFIGNRTECALLMMARKWGADYAKVWNRGYWRDLQPVALPWICLCQLGWHRQALIIHARQDEQLTGASCLVTPARLGSPPVLPASAAA